MKNDFFQTIVDRFTLQKYSTKNNQYYSTFEFIDLSTLWIDKTVRGHRTTYAVKVVINHPRGFQEYTTLFRDLSSRRSAEEVIEFIHQNAILFS